jgi:hypothetical protein
VPSFLWRRDTPNMKYSKIIAAALACAMLIYLAPKPMALADGAASTRNILIGGAAAALIIINHNKKVHQRYAEDAQKQAALALQRDDARVAATQYKTAYEHEVTVASSLKREVALKDQEISRLSSQVAALNPPGSNFVAARPAAVAVAPPVKKTTSLQVVSYGWGDF